MKELKQKGDNCRKSGVSAQTDSTEILCCISIEYRLYNIVCMQTVYREKDLWKFR